MTDRLLDKQIEPWAAGRLKQRIPALAEPTLRELGLLVRPIPFFARLDRFRAEEQMGAAQLASYLAPLDEVTAWRVVRSYTFAGELCREVLRGLGLELPEEGVWSLRMLWALGVLLDQLLDEHRMDVLDLDPVRAWVAAHWSGASRARVPEIKGAPGVFLAMLGDLLEDCRERARDAQEYSDFLNGLLELFQAEALSVDLALEVLPNERLRAIVRRKSVGLCWAGFRACTLGVQSDPKVGETNHMLLDILGEILWIMDDLADLEEDFNRRVWSRALLRLYDAVGASRFRAASGTVEQLAGLLERTDVVAREIQEIDARISRLETHAGDRDGGRIRRTLAFWITAWLGVYA